MTTDVSPAAAPAPCARCRSRPGTRPGGRFGLPGRACNSCVEILIRLSELPPCVRCGGKMGRTSQPRHQVPARVRVKGPGGRDELVCLDCAGAVGGTPESASARGWQGRAVEVRARKFSSASLRVLDPLFGPGELAPRAAAALAVRSFPAWLAYPGASR